MALRRNIWALENHLTWEKECVWYGGLEQDYDSAAVFQDREHNESFC